MFKDYNQSQIQLLPPNLEELIKPDHTARLVNQVIDEMDLSFLEKTYSSDGQRAYHPRMLLKVLVYGYTIGLRSSRKLADRLEEDVTFMWLVGRQTPNFRTIADFRKDRLQDVRKIFNQVLDLCSELGMVRIGKVCLDGTTIRADASKNKAQYRKLLEKRRQKTAVLVDDILKQAEKLDEEEDKIYGNATPHTSGVPLTTKVKAKIKRHLNQKQQKQIKRTKRRQKTLQRQLRRLKAKESGINGKLRTMRKDRNSMSTTDQDATLMLMKENYIAPGYNVQFATEHQVILAYGLYPDRNDHRLYQPMIEEIKKNTRQKPKITIADAGYGTKMNYRFAKSESIAAHMPYQSFNQDMTARRQGVYQLPKEINVELEHYKFRQRLKLLSPEGKKLMDRRREDVEPVIGDIKKNMKFRRFGVRGKPKCLTELSLVSIGHNLKKIKSWTRRLAERDEGPIKVQELGKMLGYIPA